MSIRRVLGPIVAIAVGIVLSSCATGTGGGTDADVDYDRDAALSGSLTVLGFGASDEVAEARLAAAEEALGDEVSVELVEGDLDIQQFLSSIASGTPPTIIYANRDQLGSLAARGAVLPLERCIAGEGVATDQFVESALAQVTFDGAIYGIPEFNGVQLTMANEALLDAAGLSIDDVNGSDWEAVAAANQALARSAGGTVSVIGVDSKLPEFFPLWAKANGVDLISADGKTANIDDPKAVEALEFAVALYDAQGGFAPVKAFRDGADFFGAGNQFASGQLGAMTMENWYVNVLNDVSPDAPMAFDTFRTRTGDPIAFASGSAWAIPVGSDNPAAACRFARAMTEVDSWLAAADARIALREKDGKPFTGLLTANSEADEQIRERVEPSGDARWDSAVEAIYEANENAFSLPANPADAEFRTAWVEAVNRVLSGQASAQDALGQAQDEAQAALDEAWSKLEG